MEKPSGYIALLDSSVYFQFSQATCSYGSLTDRSINPDGHSKFTKNGLRGGWFDIQMLVELRWNGKETEWTRNLKKL